MKLKSKTQLAREFFICISNVPVGNSQWLCWSMPWSKTPKPVMGFGIQRSVELNRNYRCTSLALVVFLSSFFFFNKDFLSTQYLFLWLWCKQLNPALFVLCKWLEWPAECSALPTHRILLKKGYPSAFDQLIALIRLSEIQVLSKRKSHLSVALCRAGGWNYFCFPGAREGCKGFT